MRLHEVRAKETVSQDRITRCKDCDAEIRFIQMRSGKYMPVNAEDHVCQPGELVVTSLGTTSGVQGTRGYIPHWHTCPAAATFRKAKGKT